MLDTLLSVLQLIMQYSGTVCNTYVQYSSFIGFLVWREELQSSTRSMMTRDSLTLLLLRLQLQFKLSIQM